MSNKELRAIRKQLRAIRKLLEIQEERTRPWFRDEPVYSVRDLDECAQIGTERRTPGKAIKGIASYGESLQNWDWTQFNRNWGTNIGE